MKTYYNFIMEIESSNLQRNTEENYSLSKVEFIKVNFNSILSQKGQERFFKNYEYPLKQQALKKYWQQALIIYLKQYKKGAATS